MLEIKDLHASINGKEILKGINLTIRDGEVHALMGQNGAGKSTLSNVLVGHPAYEVTRGSITFNGKDLLAMSPEDRAHEGIFLSFQAPVEIPGVSMVNFMHAAVNEQRKYRHLPALSASEFLKLMREKRAIVELDNKLANRSVNEGFSGGEKKRNEIFQMAMLEPTFAILDETDSGLDVDALRIVADGFNKLKTAETSAMVITHYQRLLDYISRSLRDIAYKAIYAKENLQKTKDKEPTIEEIAEEISIPKEDIVMSLDAISAPLSLYEPVYQEGGDTLYIMDQIRDRKNKEEMWVENLDLREAMDRLCDREKNIVRLRFFEGKTQTEVAEEICISQAQVSRLEKNAIKSLRRYLEDK